MELKGRIGLIKYVRRITDIGLIEAKETVEAFLNVRGFQYADTPIIFDNDIVILSLFVGKIKSGEWVIRDGKVLREATVSDSDLVNLTKF